MSFYVGIDWATQAHQVCVLDEHRQIIDERSVPHTGEELTRWIDELLKLVENDPSQLAVAIETPRSAVVDMLMERTIAVYSVNPKQLDRFRDRHTVAGAKDDRRDAFVLADSLRTDRENFRLVRLGSAELVQLRELVTIHEEVVDEARMWGGRARELLLRYFPQLLQLGSIYTDPWMWAVLEEAATPATARELGRERIANILKENHVRRVSADDVIAVLRAPALSVAPGVADACGGHLQIILPRLRLAHRHRLDCLRNIENLLDAITAPSTSEKSLHRDAFILASWPGIGTINRAAMLAEAWEAIEARDLTPFELSQAPLPLQSKAGNV